MYELDFKVIFESWPFIVKGIEITLLISILSSFFAFLIGLSVSFIRSTKNFSISFLAVSYVEIVRNTPLLIQLYIIYKGLPSLGINLPGITCGIIALSIYTGAFISEVLRSGINSITNEQTEAARGLGLTRLQTFRLVIFPQSIRIIIPPLGSQFINLIKNSSLVSFIAVNDLFYVIYKGAVDDFRIYEFFLLGVFLYMALTGIVALITNFLEYKFKIAGRALRV